MKKILIIITGLCFGLTSCKEDLIQITPLTNNTANDFYVDEYQLNQATLSIYNAYNTVPVSSNWYLSEVRADNTHEINSGGAQRDWADIGLFQASSQTGALQTAWTNLYSVIYRSNILLEKSTKFKSALALQMQAEARYFRALAYFDLVRFWGDVPLVTTILSINDAKFTARTPREEVYKKIVDDLQQASQILPETYAAVDKGRATKYAAKAVLARVYLTMAGFPLKQADKLDLAKKELADIIAQEAKYFAFPATYKDLFTVAGKNKSNVFEVQYISGGTGLGNQVPAVQAFQYPSQWSAFQPIDGFDGEPDPLLVSAYGKTDVRKVATLDSGYTDTKTLAKSGRVQFTKFLEKGSTLPTNNRDYATNFPVVRYADVLLMYAEILNEQGSLTEANAILNRVRAFAKATVIAPKTQAEFRLAMEQERRLEFAAEGLRWHDLVRTGRAIEVMNAFAQIYSIKLAKPINENDLIFPIPLNEMNINPGFWKQNAGYN
ncbi:MAG: RagB/SusD family nutrient uptake outer membrane protein [Bacteroidota bacterium]